MLSSTTRKRKAETTDDDSSDRKASKTEASQRSGQLHLPSPVWGHVLDYMPYQEVRSALMVCKSIADGAVRYVHTLNIMRDCELDIAAARRFSNVEHANVLCLIKQNEESHGYTDKTIISPITTRATVPFIQMFPRLSSVFVGGLVDGSRRLYSPYQCYGKKHILLFRSLVSSFIGAYKTRALSQEISLSGVFEAHRLNDIGGSCQTEREEGDSPNECRFCLDACKHLPLRDYALFQSGRLCLDDETRDDILVGRKGGPNVILMAKAINVVEFILDCTLFHHLDHSIKDDRDLHKKLIDMGLDASYQEEQEEEGNPQYINSDSLYEVDKLVESLQIRPSDIPKELFYKKMSIGADGRYWDIFCKSTVDNLIARGYPIDPNDLIVVNDSEEPALQRIIKAKAHLNK